MGRSVHVDTTGAAVGANIAFEDVTRYKRLEEELKHSNEELETTNEELQSTIEELETTNEELQSTNEELETMNEELQSTNEELNTVNEELHARNEELSRVNSDLTNLLANVHIAIVMVASDLRIRRFTPMAERVLNLIPTDMGRPISDIKPNIDCPDIEKLIGEAIDSVSVKEREVRDRQGKWYSLRIRPYKNMENRIDGAVLVLTDARGERRVNVLHGSSLVLRNACTGARFEPVIDTLEHRILGWSGCGTPTLRQLELSTGEVRDVGTGEGWPILATPGGRLLWVDGARTLWSLSDGGQRAIASDLTAPPFQAPDGRLLLALAGPVLRFLDAEGGESGGELAIPQPASQLLFLSGALAAWTAAGELWVGLLP